MPECKLSPGAGACRINATPGSVTLSVEGTAGGVQFESASYNGQDIPGLPSDTITIDVVPGSANLDVVYIFSDPANGTGVLKEACTGNTALGTVSAQHPFQRYPVCASDKI